MTMQREGTHTVSVKLPVSLKDYLQGRAENGFRTLSREVVKRLQESCERDQQPFTKEG